MRHNRSRDFQASTKSSDKEIIETFVYMGFFPFSKFLLVSIWVSVCALKVRLLDCEIIEKWMFSSRKTFTVTLKKFPLLLSLFFAN